MKQTKKFAAGIAGLFLLLLTHPISAATPLPYDFNKDGKTDSQDAVYLYQHIQAPETYPLSVSGDSNGDGQISEDDVLYLVRHVLSQDRYPLIADTSLQLQLTADGTAYSVVGLEDSAAKEIVVPDTYMDLPIVSVSALAFSNNQTLTSVTLGKNIQSIDSLSFYNCNNLSKVYILNEDIRSVSPSMIYLCDNLNTVFFAGTPPTWHEFDIYLEAQTDIVFHHGHEYTSVIIEPPSCTMPGVVQYTCSHCDRTYQDTLPKLGHAITEGSRTPPTCTQNGTTVGICSVCGETSAVTVPALGHTFGVTIQNKAPSCTEPGQETRLCSTCHEEVVISLPMTGHTPGPFTQSGDFCGENAVGSSCCTTCGEEIFAVGHQLVTSITHADCHTDGTKTTYCVKCDYSTTETIPSPGHIPGRETLTTAPTCTDEGEKTVSCLVCGECLSSTSVPTIDHTLTMTVTGTTAVYRCVQCDYSYSIDTSGTYCITFDTLGGTPLANLYVPEGVSPVLPTPVYEGYEFLGWFKDDTLTIPYEAEAIGGDITLYAQWAPEYISASANTGNSFRDATTSFVFTVISSIPLTDSNLNEYVQVLNSAKEEMDIYIQASAGNRYTIAGHYSEGDIYHATVHDSLKIDGTDEHKIWFVIDGQRREDVVIHKDVTVLAHEEVSGLFHQDGKTYLFLDQNKLSVGDKVLVCGQTATDFECAVLVTDAGMFGEYYLYECVAAEPDEIFEKFDIFYNDTLDLSGIDLTTLEEELISSLYESDLYHAVHEAGRQYAITKSYADMKYYYDFNGFKLTKFAVSVEDADEDDEDGSEIKDTQQKLIVTFELSTAFSRLDTQTREVVDYIKLSVGMDLSATFYASIALREDGRLMKSLTRGNFEIIVGSERETNLFFTVSASDDLDFAKEKDYFKELVKLELAKDKNKGVDSAPAKDSNTKELCDVSVDFYGFHFGIRLVNTFDFSIAAELGVDLYNSSVEEVIFSARDWNITTASHSGESTRMSVYLAGKIEVSDTIGLYVYVDFLRLAELNVSIHPGLYFEMGGLVSITWENWSETNKIFAGYVEAGLIVKVRGGYKVNLLVKKFEDEIDFLEKRFILFSAGEKELPLYFQYPEETFELQANLGEKISLVDKHDKTVVVQDLILLDTITKEAKKFTYSLHSGGKYATVSSSGVLTVIGCDENNLAEIVVKITSDTISKYVTYRISVPGHEHTFESTLTSSVSCVTDTVYHRECTSCAFYFDETTEEAWGHSGEWVVIQETTCTITGYSDRVCDVCGHIDRKFERRFNHDYTAQIPTTAYLKKAATCQKQAEYYYACQNCGGRDTRFFYLYGDLGDHAYADPYTCHDRPCLTEGCTYTCPATTEHNFTDWLEQEPLGCMANEDPFFVRCCKDCRFFEPNQSQTWHHDLAFGELSAPTCTEEGILSYVYCTKCDYVDPFPHTAPALGHDMVYIYDPERNGHIYTCQRFGCDLEERFAEHTWVVVREATCTTPGIRSIHCTLCGYSATEDIPALGHSLHQQEAKEPSCLSVGWNAHESCSRCSYTTKVEIPALNHIPGGWQGTRDTGHSIRCQRPGCHSVLAQKAHTYGDWIIQTQPSRCGTPDGASGTKYKECSVCGYQEFGTIPAPDCIPGPAATCTSPQICTVCGSRISDALGHRPSWISDGTDMHHWYCSNPGCDYTGDAEPHAFGDWTVNSSPTCVNDGLKTRKCRLCQYSESESIPKKAHTYISVPATPPTCVNDGWGAYQYCQQCGDSTQLTIAALGHTYGEWQIDEEKGVHYQYCTNDFCDSGVGHRFNAAAHTYGAWSTYKEASCTVDGEERRECTVCFSHEARPIEANHKPGPVATCYAPQICTLCQIELVPATDHDIHYVSDGDAGHYTVCRNANCDYKGSTEAHTYENVLYEAPTCAKEGKNVQKCVVCAHTVTTILDKTDHTLIAIEAKAPSCQEGGWNAYVKCTNEGCSYSTYEDNKLSSLGGHLWGEWQYTESAHSRFCTRDACQGEDTHTPAYGKPTVVAPKCLDDGYTRHSCTHTGCGYFYDDSPTQQLGHKLKDMDGMDPTCTEAGYVMYVICTRSGCDFNTKSEIPALGHDFDTTWYSENPSTHYYPCTREGCDAKEREETHTWSDWTIITAATCTEDGVQTKSCLVCERTETQNISAPGHTPAKAGLCTDDILCTVCGEIVTPGKDHEGFVKVVTDPTCTEGGFTTYTCRAAHCGYQYVDSYTDPLSHKPADTYTVSEDTLYHYHACLNNCGTELDIAEHTFTDWVITSNPACVKEGVQEKVCVDCSHKVTQSIPPTGHSLYLDTESKRLPNTEEGIIRYEISIVELCHNCTYHNVLASSIEHGHGSTVTTAGKPATCTEDGYHEAVYCAFPDCNELLLPRTVIPAWGHEFVDGYCIRCGSGKPTASEELAFKLSKDGTHYIVSGIGTCTDTDIVIPDTHEGLPVKEIGGSAFMDCVDISSVSIPDSVISIGKSAFRLCTGLTSISIPDSVVSIGQGAFYGCNGLTSITIPKNISSISDDTFFDCTGLTSITIPGSVSSIGSQAFFGCSGLTSITIPESVTHIGNRTFSGCTGLTSITVSENNPVYHSSGNCLIETESKTLLRGCKTSVIPSDGSIAFIGGQAFSGCTEFTSITLPDSVTSIGFQAFSNCTNLKELVLSRSVTQISDHAFISCRGLTVLHYMGTPSQWENISKGTDWDKNTLLTSDSIYYYSETEPDYSTGLTYWHYVDGEIVLWEKNELIASEGLAFTLSDDGTYYIVSGIGTCTDTDIVIPDTHEGLPVRTIGIQAFCNLLEITSVSIPNSVVSIGDEAFYDCFSLTSVQIPDSVTSIGDFAFSYCPNITSITVSAGNPVFHSDGNCLIATESKTLIFGCNTSVIPSDGSVTSIGSAAFCGCTSLSSITIPNSVTSIGDRAFYDCTDLTSITFFEGVTYIGDEAFYGCTDLTSITLPNSVTSIGDWVFFGCTGLTNIIVSPNNPVYHSDGNCLIETESKTLRFGCSTSVIPSDGSVTSIGDWAFRGYTGLTSITIPNSVTSIGSSAFRGCTGLTSITIPNSVTSIGSGAFYGCTGLTSITISHGVTSIGSSAFYGCTGLTSITIPDSVTSIGDWAFAECTGLTSISIPNSVTSIGRSAFYGCTYLKQLVISHSVTSIGAKAFGINIALSAVYYTGTPSQWAAIQKDAMWNANTQITADSIYYYSETEPDYSTGHTYWHYVDGEIVLWKKIGIASEGLAFTLSDDGTYYIVSGIGTCTDTDIVIPDVHGGLPVKEIGVGAFENCSNITSLYVPQSITFMGKAAFYKCSTLMRIVLPDSITSVSRYTFGMNDALHAIHYKGTPSQWAAIQKDAMWNANTQITADSIYYYSETEPDYSTGLTYWHYVDGEIVLWKKTVIASEGLAFTLSDNGTYYIVSGIGTCTDTDIVIPDTHEGLPVKEIGDSAFFNLPEITSVSIPNTITIIGPHAFNSCTGLTSITIPDSVTYIDRMAFFGCSGLTSITVLPNNPVYHSEGNCLIDTKSEILLFGCSTSIIPSDGSVTSINRSAFALCTDLTSITIPNSVTSIGDAAFNGCTGLTSITLPNSVTYIGQGVFFDCTNLTSITLPDSVTYVGNRTFENCTSLATIYYMGTPSQWENISNGTEWDKNTLLTSDSIYYYSETEPDYSTGLTYWHYVDGKIVLWEKNELIASEGLAFTLSDDGKYYIVSGIGTCTDTDIVIPDTHEGLPVKEIGNSAFNGCTNLASIIIPEGVTSIGNSAFYGCTSLSSITIPEGVTSISDNTFAYCTSLTSITLPDSITSIGWGAFEGCTSLTSIAIPRGITDIDGRWFDGCTGLTSVTIPESVTFIGDFAFGDCPNITSITVSAGNPVFHSDGNCLIATESKTLIFGCSTSVIPSDGSVTFIGWGAFCGCTELASIIIPGEVTGIGSYAFSGCSNLTSITLPDSITSIGWGAFEGCTSLTRINLPRGITDIDSYLFYGCSNLTSITIPENVTKIGDSAFYDCSGLTSITIPEGVTSFGYCAFSGCTDLTSISIPDKVTSIGDRVFNRCSSLTSVTIPESVTVIGEGAFAWCSNLTSITVSANNPVYHSNGNCLIETGSKTLLRGCSTSVIPSDGSVTMIGDFAFSGCNGLASITIPEGVTHIGDFAFSGCSGLASITIPASVTSIGDEAFYGCSNLAVIYYTGTPSQWEVIQKDSRWNIKTQLTADSIYYYSETGPDFSTGHTYWHYVDEEIVLWIDTSLASKNLAFTLSGDGKYYIVSGIGTCTDTDIVIPDVHGGLPVKEIGVGAFENCSNITSLYVPQSITFMGKAAFYKCSTLMRIVLPDSITSVSRYTFGMNDALHAIHYKGTPAQWTAIQKDAMWNANTQITADSIYYYSETEPDYSTGHTYWHYVDGEIVLWKKIGVASEGLAFILSDDGTYYIVSGIGTCTDTEIVIPDTHEGLPVKEIGIQAFFNLLEITSVSIPNSVVSIGDEAFYACYSLTSVQIPDSVTSIGKSAFEDCAVLTSITIPDSVTSMGWRAFAGCESASSLSIGTGIASIANYTFDGCTSLVSVVVPDNVTSIGDGVFCGCTGLASVKLSDNITWIACRTFAGCSNLTSVTLGTAVTNIAAEAFHECSSLTSIVLPESVTFIGDDSFMGCANLSTIYYKGIPAQWDNITINDSWNANTQITADSIYYYSETEPDYSTGLTYWHYVDGEIVLWKKIGVASEGLAFTLSDDGTYYIVSGIGTCTDTEIVIPDTHEGLPVKEIGNSAFNGCTGLTSIIIPEGVTSIGNSAFYGCTSLTSITIPDSVTYIGAYAFCFCKGLTSITIPDSVTYMDWSAFVYCTGLTSFTISPNNPVYHSDGNCLIETESKTLLLGFKTSVIPSDGSVTSIGARAFDGCSVLTCITIPDSVTYIGSYAFNGCTGLTSITIPDSVTYIGFGAFQSCTGLTSITIRKGVTFIENYAFNSCTGLTSITIPDGVTSIGESAFGYCTGLTSITIPDSVTYIGLGAFQSCTGLTSITIPDNVTYVTSIGNYAFYGCTGLTSITIPDSVTYIGDGAFQGCTSLTTIHYTGTMEQWSAITKVTDWNANTPSYTVICTDGTITK